MPIFYNHKQSVRCSFLWNDAKPIFPFSFGLSYTTFEMKNVRFAKKQISCTGEMRAIVDLTNTGKLLGTEIVQLYIRDLY